MMSIPTFKKPLGAALSLLLVLCLSPGDMKRPWSVGLADPGIPQHTVFITPVSDAGAGSIVSAGRRAQFHTCDGPFKNAFILGRIPFGWAGGSLPFLAEDHARFAHRADRTAIPIRAPPCLHS